MAKNLLGKVGTLVRAGLHGVRRAEDDPDPGARAAQHFASMEQQREALTAQILHLDEQIDAALIAHRDAEARQLNQQRQVVVQQLASLEALLSQSPAATAISTNTADALPTAAALPLSQTSEEDVAVATFDEADLSARRTRLSRLE